MNGAMVALSILPAAGTLSGLAKTGKTFNVGWKIPEEISQANLVIHGNSKLSPKPATLYELYLKDGTFQKYGISQNPATRYSNSFMADKDIFPITSGPRSEMLKLERQMVTANPGPLNLEPWAKAARAAGRGQ
jgi:hypothetical protein